MDTSQDELVNEISQNVQMRFGTLFNQKPTLSDRVQRFAPGLALQIFILAKFSFVFYLAFERPWHTKETPFVLVTLAINTIVLISAITQDFCTLILTWIITCSQLILYVFLLIVIPIFLTDYFASEAQRYMNYPHEWKVFKDFINYESSEERRFRQEIEYGFGIEMVLVCMVFVIGVQFALLNATLNAKLDHSTRQKQVREKRNSVYLI